MGSPTFNKEMFKRLMINMLGPVNQKIKDAIEDDLNYIFDPALSIADVESLINFGITNLFKLARRYNPE